MFRINVGITFTTEMPSFLSQCGFSTLTVF